MNKVWLLIIILYIFNFKSFAQKDIPDTVYTGVYVTSIHDIDFKQNEYTVNLWLWLKYKNVDFDFMQNLEIPQAKNVTKSYSTLDSSADGIYILMKLQCVMKDSWKIDRFPFDRQKLHLSIENSQFDSRSLIFMADTVGKHFDPMFTINGWNIDTFKVSTQIKMYETAFGDVSLDKPHSEYSAFKVDVGLRREAIGLFWKMFLGMYVAFLIAYVCFYIHADSIESRFGLTVGSLFAVIGNKYIIDSSLPESTTFTLVDTLHGLTLFFIFAVIVSSIHSLYLIKKSDVEKANKFDKVTSKILLAAYLILNIYYIMQSNID